MTKTIIAFGYASIQAFTAVRTIFKRHMEIFQRIKKGPVSPCESIVYTGPEAVFLQQQMITKLLLMKRCRQHPFDYLIALGWQRWCFSMATRPQPPQTYCMAESLSLHICLDSLAGEPQKLHFCSSSQGLHRCPGASATAPQFLHVYAIVSLLIFLFQISL